MCQVSFPEATRTIEIFSFDSMFFNICITKHNYGSGKELNLLVQGF